MNEERLLANLNVLNLRLTNLEKEHEALQDEVRQLRYIASMDFWRNLRFAQLDYEDEVFIDKVRSGEQPMPKSDHITGGVSLQHED